MFFFVLNHREKPPENVTYPFVLLENDNWDDYSYKTLFHPVIHLAEGEFVNLKDVKILQLDQGYGRTEIARTFEVLDASYCSLGQELAYYESLLTLSSDIRIDYLTSMRDAAADASIRDLFHGEDGFRVSLLRWGPAERALEDAPAILQGTDRADSKLSFTFHTTFGANEFATRFQYDQIKGLPGRINAIIGYNGTGKTRLLANLAWIARAETICTYP